jgi:hypothetical protein
MVASEETHHLIELAAPAVVTWLHDLAQELNRLPGSPVWTVGPRAAAGDLEPPADFTTFVLATLAPPAQIPGRAVWPSTLPVELRRLEHHGLAVTLWPGDSVHRLLTVRRRSPFPLTLDEVIRHLTVSSGRRPVMLPALPKPVGPSGAPVASGAPMMASSYWLEALVPDPTVLPSREIYLRWLEQYYAIRGYFPSEPRRAFRSVLDHLVQRRRRADADASG